MRFLIAVIVVASVFAGNVAFNDSTTFLGYPLFFVWNIFSVVLITCGMGVIFVLDPKNRRSANPDA